MSELSPGELPEKPEGVVEIFDTIECRSQKNPDLIEKFPPGSYVLRRRDSSTGPWFLVGPKGDFGRPLKGWKSIKDAIFYKCRGVPDVSALVCGAA
jgi:hypothetical protein